MWGFVWTILNSAELKFWKKVNLSPLHNNQQYFLTKDCTIYFFSSLSLNMCINSQQQLNKERFQKAFSSWDSSKQLLNLFVSKSTYFRQTTFLLRGADTCVSKFNWIGLEGCRHNFHIISQKEFIVIIQI